MKLRHVGYQALYGAKGIKSVVTPEDVELVKEYIMTGKAEGLIFTNADISTSTMPTRMATSN